MLEVADVEADLFIDRSPRGEFQSPVANWIERSRRQSRPIAVDDGEHQRMLVGDAHDDRIEAERDLAEHNRCFASG